MGKKLIKQETIDKILDDCDIVKVAEKLGMRVKRSGIRHKTICPFHNDTTPSLNLFSDSNQYHCFTCGAHGNVIKLVREIEALDFPHAVEWLGKEFNIDIEYEDVSDEQAEKEKKRDGLFANMAIVEDYYRKEFMKSQKAQQYAYSRWGKDYCDIIRIGYAPGYSRNLDQLGISTDMQRELGLCDKNDNDLLRERITISIRDRFSRVIGFTCRNFDGSNPKYLNNGDCDIFHKNDVLYGIDTARKEIARTQTAYLVEGAPDCMRLQSIGVTNTVACLGSAWNDKHFYTLSKNVIKVCFIPDSDIIKPGEKLPHGIKVVTDAGRLALEKGLAVYVKEIPAGDEKRDADSYFISKETFDNIPEQDYVLWWAEKLFSISNSIEEKAAAVNTVANMLTILNDSTKTDFYIAQLKKYTDGQKKTWKDALKQRVCGKQSSIRPKITTTGSVDSTEYGFIIRDRHYLIEDEKGTRTLSNFILTPMFHVLDATLSRRIFIIENIHGDRNIIELRSEELVSSDKFEAKVGEIGNYVWWGHKDDLKRVKGYLFANMDTALLIKQMGWQPQGFYAFGNGIVYGEKWHEADEYGIVKLEDKGNFYLPGHSMIYRHDRKMFLFEHNFIHRVGSTVTLREATDQIFKVFGDNGRVAFLFLLACIYHDIIAYTPQPEWFPLLYLFGPMGTGKTALAETMAAFFTKKKSANLRNSTIPGMAEEIAASANAVVVFNEYKNDLDDHVIELFKGAYDLAGRMRMSTNKDGQKEMTAVDSGIILTGQEMPTKDPALFSRTIYLTFSGSQFSQEQSDNFKELASMRDLGFTHLTIELLRYREKIEKEYSNAFYEACKYLKEGMSIVSEMERIINNWAVPLALYKVLKDELNIDIDNNNITNFIREGVKRQSVSCKTSDELASFWNTLQELQSDNTLVKDAHFRIVSRRKLKTDEGKVYMWDDFHSVIFVRKPGIFAIYQEACRSQGNTFLKRDQLEYYLMHAEQYFLGTGKQRFNMIDKKGYVVFEHGLEKTTSQRTFYFDYEVVKKLYEIDLDPPIVTAEDMEDQKQELDLWEDKQKGNSD